MPGIEETENEFRYRVNNPELYDRIRRQEITKGVSILWGRRKDNHKQWEIQAIRFDKAVFKTKAEVEKWIKDHPDMTKSFNSISTRMDLPEDSNIPENTSSELMMPKFFHRLAEFKVLDEAERLIEGWANTNKVDRDNEIFDYTEMKAALEDFLKNPTMFLQHDTGETVGKWLLAEVKETGLWAKGQVSKIGELANRAWEKILAGELKGLSVGFLRTPKFQKVPVVVDGQEATLLKGYSIFEISLVYLPANQDSIFQVAGKSYKPEKESLIQIMGEKAMADTDPKAQETIAQDDQNKKALETLNAEKAKVDAEAKALKDQIATQAKALEDQKKAFDEQAKALADLKAMVEKASQPIQKSQAPQEDAKDETQVPPQEAWKGYNPRLSIRQNFANYRMKQGGN
jgi:HK97 family phage prohead protease